MPKTYTLTRETAEAIHRAAHAYGLSPAPVPPGDVVAVTVADDVAAVIEDRRRRSRVSAETVILRTVRKAPVLDRPAGPLAAALMAARKGGAK